MTAPGHPAAPEAAVRVPVRPALRTLLTTGDPNGVGPELAVRAVRELGTGAPVVVGDRHVVGHYAARSGLRVREGDGTAVAEADVLDLLPVPEALPPAAFRPGEIRAEAGAATIAALRTAVAAVQAGRARAVVGCPHSEEAVNAAGIRFSGYPSLLARLVGVAQERVCLLLVGGGLRIVHASLHQRLADATGELTPQRVGHAARAAHAYLTGTGIAAPRIAVFGINPHAGEGGLFGDDDQRVTEPAVRMLRAEGIDVHGPFGADMVLGDRTGERRFDAYVAMYHDQGHIPVKLLAGRGAAALAVGAALVFASVGHGTAFDIAGRGVADPSAVLTALRLTAGTAPSAPPADPAHSGETRP
ncbi:PdxA family dehydrogenase [Streptomyces odontomachi]|uniref:PdxA family dehydrogenase n=1 Tax=Streptomyces odontomachi TaxID=2944940 RepID=UPI0021094A56|nr:4-hydroxythreonine-4-phosphate dehydrogenase PdxA [Streptomyces sp. ODS25]